jgi:hypothetical protein
MVNVIRDGQKVAPTCVECGCRLNNVNEIWLHFLKLDRMTDARGCKCKDLNKTWSYYNNQFSPYVHFTNIAEYK